MTFSNFNLVSKLRYGREADVAMPLRRRAIQMPRLLAGFDEVGQGDDSVFAPTAKEAVLQQSWPQEQVSEI